MLCIVMQYSAIAPLKLHQFEEAESSMKNVPKPDDSSLPTDGQTRFFGMVSEAYPHLVRAQLEMSMGRFDDAVSAAEKAMEIDPQSSEVSETVQNVKLVARARFSGNDLFKSDRFTEACAAYEQGLRVDPSNSVLYYNRAACWYKLGQWERSIDDCNHALNIKQNYTKALLRRAAANFMLKRWSAAISDYDILRLKLPDDMSVSESLFLSQVALRRSRGEDISNLKFGGDVENVLNLEQFQSAISFPGVSVVHFNSSDDPEFEDMSEFFDTLCRRYPTVNFLKVVTDDCRDVCRRENISIVPVFKVYRNGNRVKQIVCPSTRELERSVKSYSFI